MRGLAPPPRAGFPRGARGGLALRYGVRPLEEVAVLTRLLLLLGAALARLPARWAGRAGDLLGRLCHRLLPIRRRHARAQAAACLGLGPREARRIVAGVYRHLGRGVIEVMRAPHLDERRARATVGEEALSAIARARAAGRGVLVLGAHLGAFDLLACAAGRAGIPVNVVTRRIRARALDRAWMQTRARAGVRLLPAAGSAAAIRRALARGEVVAMVLDQHAPGGAVVPFFGRPAATSTALARLARMTAAPVLPAFLLRDGRGGYRCLVGEPLPPPGPGEAGIVAATARYTAVIEAAVRAAPEQWLWLHRRFKVGADGPAAPRFAANNERKEPMPTKR